MSPNMLFTRAKPEAAKFNAHPAASQLFNTCAHQGCPHALLFALDLPTLGFTNRSGVPLLECFEVFHEGSFLGTLKVKHPQVKVLLVGAP